MGEEMWVVKRRAALRMVNESVAEGMVGCSDVLVVEISA